MSIKVISSNEVFHWYGTQATGYPPPSTNSHQTLNQLPPGGDQQSIAVHESEDRRILRTRGVVTEYRYAA